MPLARALTVAARWRPTVPAALIDRALFAGRGGMKTNPDGSVRPLNFSAPAMDKRRIEMERTQRLLDPAPAELTRERVELANCSAHWLALPESRHDHVLLYLHGGAYLRGSTDTHIGALSRFMRAGRVRAFSVDYRLEPYVHFPAWVDDAVDAYRHLLDAGIAPHRIAIAGDSAGGGLTLALLQQITALELPQPACAVVISPWADLTSSGPSYTENVDTDAMFGPGIIEHTADWLAEQAGVPADHPLLSPAFGSYVGSPPLRIDVSARELLRSDAEMVAAAYRRDGGTVDYHLHATAPHAWTAIGLLAAARRTCTEIGRFIDQHVSAQAEEPEAATASAS